MRIPAFHNLPFWFVGKAYWVQGLMFQQCVSLSLSIYIIKKIEADHYGPLLERYGPKRLNEAGASGNAIGRFTLSQRISPYIPAGKTVLYGLLYSFFVFELRTAGGMLPVDSTLGKYVFGEGLFLVTDCIVVSRCLLKPYKVSGSSRYEIPSRIGANSSRNEKLVGTSYFCFRLADGMLRSLFFPTHTMAMIPLAMRLAKFGIWTTWGVVTLPVKIVGKLL